MSQSKLVLVTGAIGNQGGAVVQALLTRGHQVRALTRNSASPAANRLREYGVEIAVGDFADHDSLVRAARGVDAVYAMSTPFEQGVEKETAQGIAITNAAKVAGVGHLIYSSVANADEATGIPHFESKYAVEKFIASSGVRYTIIAPVYFMENLTAPWALPGLRQGKLSAALPADRPLQQIAVQDVGAFAAAIIERHESVFGRRFDIAGDEVTGEESAASISETTGRNIQYVGFSPDALRAQSEDSALMFEWLRDTGYSADVVGLRRDFPEITWHDFATWVGQQDWDKLIESEPTEAGWGGNDG